jgi:hypothetical protein
MKKCLSVLSGLIMVALLLYGGRAQATHLLGGEMTWACDQRNPCLVTFTYTGYRQCGPSALIEDPGISLTPAPHCLVTPTVVSDWSTVFTTELPWMCPGVNTTCNGGTAPGVEVLRRSITYNLCAGDASCAYFDMSWGSCCRAASNTGIVSPTFIGIGGQQRLKMNLINCNSSPVFNNLPTMYVCSNETSTQSFAATDPDGNVLQYSLANCLGGGGTVVGYPAGFGPTSPLGPTCSVTINPATGMLTITSTSATPITGAVCVRVDELNSSGVVIGSVTRDIQVTVINCANETPTLSGPTQIQGCMGQKVCLTVTSNDADAADVLTVTVLGNTTGGTPVITGSPHPTTNLCFTPTAAGTYTLQLQVRDNGCPVRTRTVAYTFTILQCSPCDLVTINPSFTHVEGLLQTTVTNTSTVTPLGLGPIFTHFVWGDGTNNVYSGNYTTPVTHTYPAPGTYTFCLIIEAYVGDACCHDTVCTRITVTDNPCDFQQAHFYAVGNISPPCSYTFWDDSSPTSSTNYWDFGDGSPLATGSPVTHVFATGTWTITLTSIYHPPGHPEICCTATYSQTFTMNCGRHGGHNDIGKMGSPKVSVHYDDGSSSFDITLTDALVQGAPVDVAIYDLSGKLLYTAKLDKQLMHQVSVPSLAKGVYLARFASTGATETTKFVVR